MSLLHTLVAAQGALAPLAGKYNEKYGEWDELRYGPLKFWKRDEAGRPRLLGIPFPRLIRGARK